MKNLFRVITFIPKLLIRLVWRLFVGLLKTALVIALLFFAVRYFMTNSNSQVGDFIANQVDRVSTLFSNSDTGLLDSVGQLTTDSYQHADGARWSSNSATVYIATEDKTLASAYETALANWNATGSFRFNLTDDQSTADIVAMDYSDSNSEAAGLAETQTNTLTNHITHVDVKLNRYYLLDGDYGYDFERIVHTAEHELGHAIGLAHEDSQTSVMESSGSYNGIQESDVAAVHQLYGS